ncbi:MAG: hypothetical protein FWC23_05355 [Chitinispirillia bacterium]|nr:hypothetical protein [Chitinispirillia bacterium]MCL2268596.1 hypothetical protein [Chitinispirillia bacterium]
MNPIFTKGYRAAAEVSPNQIVAWAGGSVAGSVTPAMATTDKLVGVTGLVGAAEGGVADVHRIGIAEVRLGGTVALGDEITSDGSGFGVTLTGAGESIGRAERAGVAGDIINVFLRPLTAAS